MMEQNIFTEQEARRVGIDAFDIYMGILDGSIVTDPLMENLHGKIVGARFNGRYDVTVYEDGFEY